LISIAHRRISNRQSGVLRHGGEPRGIKIINGEEILAFSKDERDRNDARIYHDSIPEHIRNLGLDKNKNFILDSNGNLGNNFWNVSWEYDKGKRLYCLKDEPFLSRPYTCFIVPKGGEPRIQRVAFNELEDLIDEDGKNISDEVKWCNYGQQIVKDGKVVPVEDIIEEFYDVRHIFDLRDWADKNDSEGEPRMKRDLETMKEIYKGYPDKFKDNMLRQLGKLERGRHYHNVLGIDDEGIVIYHSKGKIEDIAERLAKKGVRDAIILDNGGSVGLYASWLDGFLNKCSYFRPERISYIAFVLK
jgi:hypothetical protein